MLADRGSRLGGRAWMVCRRELFRKSPLRRPCCRQPEDSPRIEAGIGDGGLGRGAWLGGDEGLGRRKRTDRAQGMRGGLGNGGIAVGEQGLQRGNGGRFAANAERRNDADFQLAGDLRKRLQQGLAGFRGGDAFQGRSGPCGRGSRPATGPPDAGTEAAVPMVFSARHTASLAARGTSVLSTAMRRVSRSLRAAASPWVDTIASSIGWRTLGSTPQS